MLDYNRENYLRYIIKKVIVISIIAGLIISLFYFMRGYINNQPYTITVFFISFVFSSLVTFLIFLLNLQLARSLEKKLPWSKRFIKRLLVGFILSNLIAVTVIILIQALFLYFFGNPEPDVNLQTLFVDRMAQAVVFNTIAVATVEFGVVFKQWKKSLINEELLEKENILSQFEALKHQLNPHFMFNSLNALSSLIDDDPKKANKFLSMFSKMYRYILEVKDKLVVEVNEELEFVNAYIFMQQIRYNENLNIEIKIHADNLRKFLPPLSLQLLVENAIKHNEISNDHHLNISITDDIDKIIVKNNLKYRENQTNKSGIGLENLQKRIKFISDKKPEFFTQNGEYIAIVPFIDIDE